MAGLVMKATERWVLLRSAVLTAERYASICALLLCFPLCRV